MAREGFGRAPQKKMIASPPSPLFPPRPPVLKFEPRHNLSSFVLLLLSNDPENGDGIDHGLHRLRGWRKLELPMRENTLAHRVNAILAASPCISASSASFVVLIPEFRIKCGAWRCGSSPSSYSSSSSKCPEN